VKAQYGAVVAPEGAAFVVVGGVEQARVAKALEERFGGWSGKPTAKAAAVSEGQPEKAVFFVDFPGATQTALTVARRAPGEGTPEYFPAMVMSRVLGEAFTSRLNLNLREAKGYTYGARSGFQRYASAGFFALSASVKRETTRASIDETFRELQDLCASRPVSETERDEAVSGLLLGFPGRFERGGDVAAQLASIPLHRRSDDWLEQWPGRVKAVGVADANAVAKGYCNPDDYVVVLAGDRKLVEPTLAGLERKVRFFDAQGKRAK
jgi:zinc protease